MGKVTVDLVRGYSGKRRVDRTMCECCPFSRVRLFATPGTVAHQAPPSMGFSRQEHWSGLPCPPPGDLPNPGSEPRSLMSSALAGGFFITSATWKAPWHSHLTIKPLLFETAFLQIFLGICLHPQTEMHSYEKYMRKPLQLRLTCYS